MQQNNQLKWQQIIKKIAGIFVAKNDINQQVNCTNVSNEETKEMNLKMFASKKTGKKVRQLQLILELINQEDKKARKKQEGKQESKLTYSNNSFN